MRVSIPLLTAAFYLFSLGSSVADWPRWRGPEGTGHWLNAPRIAATPDGLEESWAVSIGSGYSGVTVSDGRVYTMDKIGDGDSVTERILCLDAETGEMLWTHEYEAPYDGLPYGSGPRGSVTIHEGYAYAMGATAIAFCLKADTGEMVWSLDSEKELKSERPRWGYAASPVIWKDTVILHNGAPDGNYLALKHRTGEEVWRGSGDPAGYATPVFAKHAGEDIMIGWTPQHIQSLNPDTGEVNWQVPYEIRYGVSIATPIVKDGMVLVCGYWHGSRGIRLGETVKDAELLWSVEENLNGLMAQPLVEDGLVYLLDKDNGLTCFDLQTGEKKWDDDHEITPAGRNPQATFVRLGESLKVLILNANGELLHGTLSPEGYEEYWREQVIGKTWAHPAYAGTRVYARDDNRLAAWELPIVE